MSIFAKFFRVSTLAAFDTATPKSEAERRRFSHSPVGEARARRTGFMR